MFQSYRKLKRNLDNEITLQIMTNPPTPMNIVFTGSLPANRAAKGAATVPPTINPRITGQWLIPSIEKNVIALASVIKNSVMLTEPITYCGLLPFDISVLVTNGPQPPPPNESRKPPAPASQPTRFTFFGAPFLRKAFISIFVPKN